MAGGLNDTTATTCAQAICSANGVTDPASINKVANMMKAIYAALLTDILITIAPGAIATTGTATAQAGPPAPVPISPNP